MKMTVTHKKGSVSFDVSVIPREKDDYGTGNYVSVFNDNSDYYLDGRYWGKMDTDEKLQQYLKEWARDHWGDNLVNVEFDGVRLVPMPGINKM